MNRLYPWIVFGSLLLTFCRQEPAEENELGAIYLNDFGMCFPTFNNSENTGYVITNNSQYQALRNSTLNHYINCDTAQLPTIDFNIYSLLGYFTEGTCSLNNTKEIVLDQRHRQYIYKIKVQEYGMCKMLVTTMNWALVPRLPGGYKVVFDVSEPE